MRLAFSFFLARITDRRHSCVVYGRIAGLGVLLLSGCGPVSDVPPDVPDHVRSARLVLGEEATVAGGIRISGFYRSFMAEIEQHFDLDDQRASTLAEQNRKLLERFGLDPMVDDVTLAFAYHESELHSSPGIVLRAPFPEAALQKLADRWYAFEKLEDASESRDQIRSDLPVFALNEEDPALLVAQPLNDMLMASGSAKYLSEMIERSTSASVASNPETISLFHKVGGADAWLTATSLPAIMEAMSADALPNEMQRILSAIVGIGASLQLEDDAVNMNVYLEPKSGIDESDLSDLVRGAIALLKLESSDTQDISDFLKRIGVSEMSGFSRVQLSVTEQDLENLIRSVDWD